MSTEVDDILLLEEVAELTRLPQATLRFYRHRGYGGPPKLQDRQPRLLHARRRRAIHPRRVRPSSRRSGMNAAAVTEPAISV